MQNKKKYLVSFDVVQSYSREFDTEEEADKFRLDLEKSGNVPNDLDNEGIYYNYGTSIKDCEGETLYTETT